MIRQPLVTCSSLRGSRRSKSRPSRQVRQQMRAILFAKATATTLWQWRTDTSFAPGAEIIRMVRHRTGTERRARPVNEQHAQVAVPFCG